MRGTPLEFLYRQAMSVEQLQEEAKYDATRLFNMLALLRLHNVTTQTENPSPQLNAKRKSRGKLPLYSYKILVVDGERWDTPSVVDEAGEGYRSHLRRGHIRRLSDDRAVWVRATFVHGRKDGFVDKDYDIRSPA